MTLESGALIGALIGAGGAISAQVVSAYIAGKRESRRIEVEDRRRGDDLEAERASRFSDVKRELYAAFAEKCYTPLEIASEFSRPSRIASDPIQPFPRTAEYEREISRLRWQIRLIAHPVVIARSEICFVNTLLVMLQVGLLDEFTDEKRRHTAKSGLSSWQKMVAAMRADLLNDEVALSAMMQADSHRSQHDPAETPSVANLERRLDELLQRHRDWSARPSSVDDIKNESN